jgi:arylsulfatase A-like enzyme
MTRIRLWLWLLVAVAGCVPAGERSGARPNILVVLVDTLRADRLGAYGSTRGLTPFLDGLAARGCVFERAYAPSPWTNPSVASLFTSRFQSQHGIITFASALAPGERTLAAALREAGYVTGGFVANGLLNPGLGFGRGFDAYQALWPEPVDGHPGHPGRVRKRRADEINALALDWLDGLPASPAKPVFLYLHYVEPHQPYSPPTPILARLLAGRPAPDLHFLSQSMTFARVAPPDEATHRDLELVYDAEVASVDASLATLFPALERRGFLRHAIVVVTSDHGEEFKEHGSFGHGGTLFNELIWIPLLLHGPGVTPGRLGDVVSLLDVAPTLLDLVGGASPPSFEGRSLRDRLVPPGWSARLVPRRSHPAAAFSELLLPEDQEGSRLSPHERAIVLGARKLVVGPEGEKALYDLAHDPGEQNALEPSEDDELLRVHLAGFLDLTGGAVPTTPTQPLDPDTQRRLRAFGYVN